MSKNIEQSAAALAQSISAIGKSRGSVTTAMVADTEYLAINGYITANIGMRQVQVFCARGDDVHVGDEIQVRQTGSENISPWILANPRGNSYPLGFTVAAPTYSTVVGADNRIGTIYVTQHCYPWGLYMCGGTALGAALIDILVLTPYAVWTDSFSLFGPDYGELVGYESFVYRNSEWPVELLPGSRLIFSTCDIPTVELLDIQLLVRGL